MKHVFYLHNIPEVCDPRQNGVPPFEAPKYREEEENRDGSHGQADEVNVEQCVHEDSRVVHAIDTAIGELSFDLIVKAEGEGGLLTSNNQTFHWSTNSSTEMEIEFLE